MEQKTILIHHLHTGISLILLILLNSCAKEIVEYRLQADFLYVNHTDNKIAFNVIDHNGFKLVTIPPNTSSDLLTLDISGAPKDPTLGNSGQILLDNLYGGAAMIKNITINDTMCITIEKEGSLLISNYESTVKEERYFEYRYTFTENDIAQGEKCK